MRNSRHPRRAARLAVATAALIPLLAGALVAGAAHARQPEPVPDAPVVEPLPDAPAGDPAPEPAVVDPAEAGLRPETESVPVSDAEPTAEPASMPEVEPTSDGEPAPEAEPAPAPAPEPSTPESGSADAVKAATPVLAPGQSYIVNRTFTNAYRIDVAIVGPVGLKRIELVTPSGALGSTTGGSAVLDHHLETGSPLADGSYRILIHNLSDQPMSIEYEITARSLAYLFRPEPARPSAGLFVAVEALYATEPLSSGTTATVRAVGADGAEYTAPLRRDPASPERWTAFLGNVVGAFLVHAQFTTGGRVHDVAWTTTIVELDRTLPVVEYLTDPAASNARGWFARPVTVTLRASDSGSGIDRIEWQLDDGPLVSTPGGQVEIELSHGIHRLDYRAYDAAGNVTGWQVREPRIDTVAPFVTAEAPVDGAEYVLGESVTVAFECDDALSGPYECQGDLGVGAALPTDAEGDFTFEIGAVDRAGNLHRETISYRVVDPGLPQVDLVLPVAEGEDGWYLDFPVLELEGSETAVEIHWIDTVDGVDEEGSATGDRATFTPDREGVHELRYWAVDARGRTGEPATVEFRIDATAPTIDIVSPAPAVARAPGDVLQGEVVVADFACADAVSGIASCVGSTPDGEALPTDTLGTHAFTVEATDAAGHESVQTITYRVVSDDAEEPNGEGEGGAPGGRGLAATGAQLAGWLAVPALALLGIGGLLLVARRVTARS